jgi:signal transduction histidine kinase
VLPVVLLAVPSAVAQAQAGSPLPVPLRGLDLDPTSLPLPDAVWTPVLAAAHALVPLSLVVPFAVVVRRYRRSRGEARTRMRWLLWAAIVDLLVMLASRALPSELTSIGLSVAVGATGAAVAAGIARPYLVDVDRLLGGTLLYAALAACVVAVDLAVVGAAGALLGERLAEREAALLALLVVAAVYAPLRHRLWRLVRRLVLGEREDPYRVVTGLAERLERSDGPEEQLLAVARTAAEAFRTPYVAVEVDRAGGERLLAEHGHRPADVQVLPIAYRGEEVGRLLLPRRGPRAVLSARDERLLGDVVRQAAAAARASHLATELQHSREQLVSAREEERRRLRRDLHDGLGPVLGAVVLRIDAARNLAASDPVRADEVLRQARDDVAAALADVRRLVHDLRPPALDDVGLLASVRQQAERLRTPGLQVRVDGEGLDDLPAAVEVAAYRIASEALANVARHAGASTCRVTLTVDAAGRLVVEVADDGVGIPTQARAGVGLVSLRERAAELGGSCEVSCPPGGGTLVRAELPLGARTRVLEVERG